MTVDTAVRTCGECRVYDPRSHTPGCRCRQCTESVHVLDVRTGTLDLGTGPIPMHTRFELCAAHAAEVIAAYGEPVAG